MNTKKLFAGLLLSASALISCNKDITFPDFDYQTVYFASQFPLRTVVLGEDMVVDNSLDKEGKVSIKATMGGMRENTNNVVIGFDVDEALLDNVYFTGGNPKVVPMPKSYYTLASTDITIPSGSILGGVEVQLTDQFFADPLSLQNTYAIPLKMRSVTGADSILRGRPAIENPNPVINGHWEVRPQDYVIYAIKFINPWEANYLRRGVDVIVGKPGFSSLDRTVSRRRQYVEQDEIKKTITRGRSTLELPVSFPDPGGVNIPMNLLLTFDGEDNCTISASGTGYTASGSGKYVKKGEVKSWGNLDRDALYLDFTIDHPMMTIASKDTLVMRDRGVAPAYFTPVVR